MKPQIVKADIHKLETAVIEQWKSDQSSAFQFGMSLLALKEAYKVKGQFQAFLRRNKITSARAYYSMAVATGKRNKDTYANTPRAVALDSLQQIGRAAYTALVESDVAKIDREEKKVLAWFAQLRKQVVAQAA